ncbi:MAG TPA: hypothetical protein VF396_04150 [Bradyrhizobium sp.]
MSRFLHEGNIALYKKLIAESERDPSRDEARYKILLRLLAEEMAKEGNPPKGTTLSGLFSVMLMAAPQGLYDGVSLLAYA